jgi:hypothetical protein
MGLSVCLRLQKARRRRYIALSRFPSSLLENFLQASRFILTIYIILYIQKIYNNFIVKYSVKKGNQDIVHQFNNWWTYGNIVIYFRAYHGVARGCWRGSGGGEATAEQPFTQGGFSLRSFFWLRRGAGSLRGSRGNSLSSLSSRLAGCGGWMVLALGLF